MIIEPNLNLFLIKFLTYPPTPSSRSTKSLVGRLDPERHRERGVLEVKNLWWEPGVRDSKGRRASLEAALDRLVRLVGAERWEIAS